MGIRKAITTTLCLFLVTTFVFVNFSFTSPQTKVCVDPTEKTAYPCDTFTIDVNITDVMDLYAYEIILYYHTIPVDGLSVELPPGHFLEPINPANLLILRKEIDDNYNATHGRVWVAVALLPPEPAKTGSGILFTITFHCTGGGTSVLHLSETELGDYAGSSIPHIRIHGLINQSATMYVDPPTIEPGVCDIFTVNVSVSDVKILYRWEFSMSFNSTAMECVAVEEGPFLKEGGTTMFTPPIINNVAGTIEGVLCTLVETVPGVNGSGTLANVTFHCKGEGESGLNLYDTLLKDSFGGDIPHSTEGGFVVQVVTTIEVSPSNMTVWVCDTFTVNITVSNVVNLYTWEFNMTFDPAAMECLSVEEGPFLKLGGTTAFTPPTINNTAGTINGANCTLTVPFPVTGSGTLANVTFHCKGKGQSLLMFSYTSLKNSTYHSIPHSVGLGSVTQKQRQNVTYRLLAVEQFFDSTPRRSAQWLVQTLITNFKNWRNETWGAFNYTSYIHILSYDQQFDPRLRQYYKGPPTNSNVVNEITNFLGQTLPGENNTLTVRIFYYIGHGDKVSNHGIYHVDPYYRSPNRTCWYLALGRQGSHREGPSLYEELYDYQLDALLLSGGLRNSNCTLVILDSCRSGQALHFLTRPVPLQGACAARVILTACKSTEKAWGWPENGWGWGYFSGHPSATYEKDGQTIHFGPLGIIGGLLNANDANSDGWLSAGEIFEFANKTTISYAANKSKSQHPQASYGVMGAGIPIAMSSLWLGRFDGQQIILEPTPFPYNARPLYPKRCPHSPSPMFRLNVTRTGFLRVQCPASSELLWNKSLQGPIFSSAALADGAAFVATISEGGSPTGTLYALDITTGEMIWSFTADSPIYSSPAVVDGIAFVGTLGGGGGWANGTLYALDEYTGLVRWNFTTPPGTGGIFASPAVDMGMVFIATLGGGGGSGGCVYALNATTGELLWNFTAAGPIKSSPAVADNMTFVATMGGGAGGGAHVYALNEFTGTHEWPIPFETDGPVVSTPAVAGGMVFVATMGGGGGGRVYALEEFSGTQVWNYTTTAPVSSSPAVDTDRERVIVGSDDGLIYALRQTDGSPEWVHPIGPINMSSPAISGNEYVYIGSTNSTIFCLNETTGEEVWSYGTGDPILSSPALTDDHVLIASMNGRMYCFGPPFPVHNVALTNMTVSPALVLPGGLVGIMYTVKNKGNVPETFNVTIGYSNFPIWTPPTYLEPITLRTETMTLQPGANVTKTYIWNTTNLAPGTYTISVQALDGPYETDLSDNIFIGVVSILRRAGGLSSARQGVYPCLY